MIKRRKGFTLIELMVVVAIIGVLAAVITPQVSNSVYRARVSATAASFNGMKMALDMLVNDIGVKPSNYGWVDSVTDQLALRKRNSCPGAYVSLWNGPYLQNYPTSKTSALLALYAGGMENSIYYLGEWGVGDGGVWGDWCGTGYGILLHTPFISYKAKQDVENVLFGRTDPDNSNWIVYCGFHDSRQVSMW